MLEELAKKELDIYIPWQSGFYVQCWEYFWIVASEGESQRAVARHGRIMAE